MDGLLTPEEISARLALGSSDPLAIVIQPTAVTPIGSFIPLHLGDSFVELSNDGSHRRLETSLYALQPQRLVLGTTREIVALPADLCGQITGKTSLARLGL